MSSFKTNIPGKKVSFKEVLWEMIPHPRHLLNHTQDIFGNDFFFLIAFGDTACSFDYP